MSNHRAVNGVAAGIAVLGAIIVYGAPGPAAESVARLLGLLCCIIVVALRFVVMQKRRILSSSVLLASCVAVWVASPTLPTLSLVYPVCLLAVADGSSAAWAVAVAVAALIHLTIQWLPLPSSVLPAISRLAGMIVVECPPAQSVTPSVIGLPSVSIAVVVLLSIWYQTKDKMCLVGVAMCVVLMSVQFWLGAASRYLVPFGFHEHGYSWWRSLPPLAVGLSACVGGIVGRSVRSAPTQVEAPYRGVWWASGAVLAVAIGYCNAWQQPDRRLTVLNVGGLDWNRPRLSKLGPIDDGMFGMLPQYCEDSGWECNVMRMEEIMSLSLASCRVLAVINCGHEWSTAERGCVERFVRNGGSLLVLADHTDVFDCMKGSNSLLGDWGIQLNFDSAYHLGDGWEDDLHQSHDRLGITTEPQRLEWGIGASLSIRYPARSLLTARYAHSDSGIRANTMGAFLGNYKWDPGEQLGDICVVASRELGMGSVVVMGDTSGFQNGSLPYSWEDNLEKMLNELSRPKSLYCFPWLSSAIIIAVLAGLIGQCIWRPAASASTCISVLGGLGLCVLVDRLNSTAMCEREARSVPSLVIATDMFPDVGRIAGCRNQCGPLISAGQRAGLTVYVGTALDEGLEAEYACLAIVSPSRVLSEKETADIIAMLSRGLTVLVFVSGPESKNVAPLLHTCGIEISTQTLGTVPLGDLAMKDRPRFADPSAMFCEAGEDTTILATYGSHVLAASRRIGSGRLVVVSDSRFCSSENTAGSWGAWGGNVLPLHTILSTYVRGAVDRPDSFGPPDKGSW